MALSPSQKLMTGVFVPLFCFGQFVLLVLLDGASWLARRKYLSWHPGSNLVKPGAGIGEQVFKYLLTPRHKWKLTPCLRTATALFIFTFNSICQSVFRFYDCVPVTDGVSVVRSVPALQCDDADWRALEGFVIFLIIVFLAAAPLTMLGVLIFNSRRGLLQQSKHRKRYGVLFEVYAEGRFFYEFIVLMRRLVMVSIVSLLGTTPFKMFAWLTFSNIIALMVHNILRPFEDERDNVIETVSLTLLALITAILGSLSFPLDAQAQAGMGVLVFTPAILFLVVIARKRLVKLHRKFSTSTAGRKSVSQGSNEMELASRAAPESPSTASAAAIVQPDNVGVAAVVEDHQLAVQ